ncbi:hypothetical protein M2T70_16760 [Elizabethkingia anophelis]|jgi:hypothetical protein|uniref:hypothetical protein n=2 Tax=Bacteroidota TaxID=976 RepID=UPI002011614D|nr:hypothetical protein [Elizabethkingia anophelis]MCL1650615.1 hypothetical protein [Elizabethkingia anophelis]MCL1682627.1 hypothetical protein [Elizabethkingia anophelis]
MYKKYLFFSILVSMTSLCTTVNAQIDSTLFKRVTTPHDSLKNSMNMDAIYNRPLLSMGKLPVAVGGYMEANWQHLGEDGVSEGHQFQFRRFTIFMASTISKRIKFMSELEFEPAEGEIAVEFAALDVEFHPLLNLRGGMIVNPIGSFNQNHDGPKWEFTDRPISATQLLPATWSNAGFGLYGKKYSGNWMFGYEAYLSSGFDGTIINNEQNKTYLPAAKDNAERFEESTSGEPLYTGKIAVRNNKIGEIGLSYMGGAYNSYNDDGSDIDDRRTLRVFAVDFNTTLPTLNTFITGEWAWINVDVPETYTQQYGNRQYGGFVDIVQPVLKRKILGWDNATLNLACRLEYVDWNVGKFRETGEKIGDETWSVVGGVSFRPNAQTVMRLNYRHQRTKDLLNNPPALLGGFSFGISTYF